MIYKITYIRHINSLTYLFTQKNFIISNLLSLIQILSLLISPKLILIPSYQLNNSKEVIMN